MKNVVMWMALVAMALGLAALMESTKTQRQLDRVEMEMNNHHGFEIQKGTPKEEEKKLEFLREFHEKNNQG